jgi:hypothetical protein
MARTQSAFLQLAVDRRLDTDGLQKTKPQVRVSFDRYTQFRSDRYVAEYHLGLLKG